ncbi:hypothetical protein PENTCL1PPCAC_21360, partial [Pristionchus entomophagus]
KARWGPQAIHNIAINFGGVVKCEAASTPNIAMSVSGSLEAQDEVKCIDGVWNSASASSPLSPIPTPTANVCCFNNAPPPINGCPLLTECTAQQLDATFPGSTYGTATIGAEWVTCENTNTDALMMLDKTGGTLNVGGLQCVNDQWIVYIGP